jgi:transposase/uncharacterized C2H2 Zn-finger protein
MTDTITLPASQGLISANSGESTGAGTPADALEVIQRMSTSDGERQESHECPTCGKMFDTPQALGSHRGLAHEQKYEDADWLKRQIRALNRSTREVAEECDVRPSVIRERISRQDWSGLHECEQCDRVFETRQGLGRHRGDSHELNYKNNDWLQRKYVEEGLSESEIARICSVSGSVIHNRLKKIGIETRSQAHSHRNRKLADPDWLREMYHNRQLSTAEIRDKAGVSQRAVVSTALSRHGIETRNPIETLGRGPENPLWKGGEQVYGEGWTDRKRRKVRERDNFTCQDSRCSMSQSRHKEEYGEKLHVHHLIKARDVDDPEERNAMKNLITLCRDCHPEWERLSEAGIRPQIDGVASD